MILGRCNIIHNIAVYELTKSGNLKNSNIILHFQQNIHLGFTKILKCLLWQSEIIIINKNNIKIKVSESPSAAGGQPGILSYVLKAGSHSLTWLCETGRGRMNE